MPVFIIYIGLFFGCLIYAVLLQFLHDIYTPDWTWITVVGGNILIGMALLALCHVGTLPRAAFWHLLGLNSIAGIPIIAWQLWQMDQRRRMRRRP